MARLSRDKRIVDKIVPPKFIKVPVFIQWTRAIGTLKYYASCDFMLADLTFFSDWKMNLEVHIIKQDGEMIVRPVAIDIGKTEIDQGWQIEKGTMIMVLPLAVQDINDLYLDVAFSQNIKM